MSPTSKDLVVCIVAGIPVMIVSASFELVEMLCEVRREYKDFYFDEIIDSMPALAIRCGLVCGATVARNRQA